MYHQNTHALVIGIGKYQDTSITPLRYTSSDARAFADVLTDENRCGVPVENVKLLVDEDATLFNIKDAISGWLAGNAGAESTSIIFWAGHGDVEPDRAGMSEDGIANYLLPFDVSRKNLFASALSKDEFQRLVCTVRSKRRVMFMDACHCGGVATVGSRKIGVGYSKDFYNSLSEGAGSAIIAAALPNELSWEDEKLGHGVFTYHLLEALAGKADLNDDGRVTMNEVFNYLKRAVPESARQLGRVEQTPVFKADMSGDIVLTINPEKIRAQDEERLRREKEEKERIRKLKSELFQVYNEKDLDTEAYNFANRLIDKSIDEYSRGERRIHELMRAMIGGAVSPETFSDSYQSFLREQGSRPLPKPKPEPISGGGRTSKPAPPSLIPRPGAKRAPAVSSELNITMVLLSLFMPIVGFVAGFVFIASSDKEKNKAGKRWLIISCLSGVAYLLLFACAVIVELMNTPTYYPMM